MKRYNPYILFILISQFFYQHIFAQQSFFERLTIFKSQKSAELLKPSPNLFSLNSYITDKTDVIILPHCFYEGDPRAVLKDSGDRSQLVIDTSNYLFVLSESKDGPCGRGRLFGHINSGVLKLLTCDSIVNDKEIQYFLGVMEIASSFPKNVFFIAASKAERNECISLGQIDNKGKIAYYDKELEPHRNIMDLMEKKYGTSYFQNDFQKKLSLFKLNHESQFLQTAASHPEWDISKNKKLEWVIVPYCYYSGNTDTTLMDGGDVTMLKFDTSRISAILVTDTGIIAYGLLKYQSGQPVTNIYPFNLVKDHLKGEKIIGLLNFAHTVSRDIFFVSLFKQPNRSYPQIGYFERGHLKFITSDVQIFNSLSELINSQYGNTENFKTEKFIRAKGEAIAYKIRVSPHPAEQWRGILKKDYTFYIRMFPEDTTKVLNLFLSEMDSLVDLSVSKKTELQTKILAYITKTKKADESENDSATIYFLRKNIYPIIASSLSKDEFQNYFEGRRINNYLATSGMYFLFNHYEKLVKKSNNDPLTETEKREIDKRIRADVWNKQKRAW